MIFFTFFSFPFSDLIESKQPSKRHESHLEIRSLSPISPNAKRQSHRFQQKATSRPSSNSCTETHRPPAVRCPVRWWLQSFRGHRTPVRFKSGSHLSRGFSLWKTAHFHLKICHFPAINCLMDKLVVKASSFGPVTSLFWRRFLRFISARFCYAFFDKSLLHLATMIGLKMQF